MSQLILYHDNCADGFCAAWIAHKKFPNAMFIPVRYNEPAPDVTGQDVLILDFSYPRATLIDMRNRAKSLQVLDHHVTAQADLKDLDFCIFNMSKSGARLTWEFLFPNQESPGLVDYTEDRDLWLWKILGSKEVNTALRSFPFDFKVWDRWDKYPVLDLYNLLFHQGQAILRSDEQRINQHVSHAFEIWIDGHAVLGVNATVLISEIAGKLAEGRPFGVCWFEDKDYRIYSLRSRDGIDVSLIAKAHGGGGHRNAAGFKEKK